MEQNFNLTPEAREERRRVILLLEQWSRPSFLSGRLGYLGEYEFSVVNTIVRELKKDVMAGVSVNGTEE